MATWLLIHSPLVGAATWTPVAAELRQRGHETIVPDLTSALSGDADHASRQADLVAATIERGPVVLVAHSGAGPLLPLIAHRLAHQHITVLASVFVDAGLPHPGQSALDVLPPPAVEQLREMTVEGWLPPWTSWWPPEQLRAMLPDEQLRSLLVDTCPRLPASLFSQVLPHLSDHELGTCSYVRLSSAYDTFANQAEQAGWPVHRLQGHHLAILTSPTEVADSLKEVADTAEDATAQSSQEGLA
jgi:hypothetical protein